MGWARRRPPSVMVPVAARPGAASDARVGGLGSRPAGLRALLASRHLSLQASSRAIWHRAQRARKVPVGSARRGGRLPALLTLLESRAGICPPPLEKVRGESPWGAAGEGLSRGVRQQHSEGRKVSSESTRRALPGPGGSSSSCVWKGVVPGTSKCPFLSSGVGCRVTPARGA